MACPCTVQKHLIRSRYIHDTEKQIYLDYNATTPPDRELLALYQNLTLKAWGHPLSPHGAGSEAYRLGEAARGLLRKSFGTEGDFLFFSSGTEGILRGLQLFRRYQEVTDPSLRFYPSSVCHPSVFSALDLLGREYSPLPVDSQGRMILNRLPDRERPVIIYSAVNHETGGREEPRRIWEFARDRGGFVFMDAVQAFPRLEEEEWLPYCHLFCISGHKFHTPRGIGLLGENHRAFSCLSPEHNAQGTQEGILPYVLAKGVENHQRIRKEVNQQLALQEQEALHYWRRNALSFEVESPREKVPGVLTISLTDAVDMEPLFFRLAERKICISRFCACRGTVEGESIVLKAMGRSPERARRSLRVSAGKHSGLQDWLALGRGLQEGLTP